MDKKCNICIIKEAKERYNNALKMEQDPNQRLYTECEQVELFKYVKDTLYRDAGDEFDKFIEPLKPAISEEQYASNLCYFGMPLKHLKQDLMQETKKRDGTNGFPYIYEESSNFEVARIGIETATDRYTNGMNAKKEAENEK